MFQYFSQMENLTVLLIKFGSSIAGILFVVLILLSNGKSNRCLNTFWPCLVGNLSVVLILFSNGKSNRCLNNFWAFDCRQSNRCLNTFWPCIVGNLSEIELFFQRYLALHCMQCILCFNSFARWKIEPLFEKLFGLPLLAIHPMS